MNSQLSPPLPLGDRRCVHSCIHYHSGQCKFSAFIGIEMLEEVIPEYSCLHPEAFLDHIRTLHYSGEEVVQGSVPNIHVR